MKKYYFTVLTILCFTGSSAQWIQQSTVTSRHLTSVHFPSPNIGYAVGGRTFDPFTPNFGTNIVLKTTDGGDTWSIVGEDNVPAALFHTDFINDNVGFAVGEYGTILKTIDGGVNWTVKNPTTKHLRGVDFVDLNTGYVVGESGIILKTSDGGDTWQTQQCNCSVFITQELSEVQFLNALTGYAVGAALVKTVDGGTTWTELSSLSTYLATVFFIDANTGYVAGQLKIFKTTDGGNNWTQVHNTISTGLYSIFFPSPSIGYVSGSGAIYKSVDSGNNWNKESVSLQPNLNGIFMIDDLKGIVVGAQGRILKTTQGGQTVIMENHVDLIGISIYPNPATEAVTVEFDELSKNSALGIYNITGKRIRSYTLLRGQSSLTFHTEDIGTGMFLLQLPGEDGVLVNKKLIITE